MGGLSAGPDRADSFEALSVRLFPKSRGAAAYAVTGIAARCDWVLLSDIGPPHTHLHRCVDTETPRHIFLSLREPYAALREFAETVLPRLRAPFVLVSGSQDVTLPHQSDRRWRGFSTVEQGFIAAILGHPLLRRWFAENLEDDGDPRMAPLPTGMVFPEGGGAMVAVPAIRPPGTRPRRVLVAHRTRPGPQWDLRRRISDLARRDWAGWCTVPEAEVSEAAFLEMVQDHAFVLCAEGGGIDPSPKAWQSLLHGAIPIIRDTGLRAAYAELPVAFVPDWQAASLTPALLELWHRTLGPALDDATGRQETLRRLGIGYWWGKISAAAGGDGPRGGPGSARLSLAGKLV